MCYRAYAAMRVIYVVGWVTGVTQLHNVVYVVCHESSIILMYTADTLSPLGEGIDVQGMRDPFDIVASQCDRQLYVADYHCCIWRVSADGHSYVKWLPTHESTTHTFHVRALSLTSRGLLVTSWRPPSLRQYRTSDRQLLRVVEMPQYVSWLWHGIEITRDTFVVGHVGTSLNSWQYAVSELFRFCLVQQFYCNYNTQLNNLTDTSNSSRY